MRILIGKGILALLALGVLGMATAGAEVVTSPTQALRLLTEARLLADKCGYLQPAERRELTQLAAQVELMAVRRAGAAAAIGAMRRARQAAKTCTEEKREFVHAVYEGAREAARRQARQTGVRKTATAHRLAKRSHRPAPVRKVSLVPAAQRSRAGRHEGDALARYRSLATAYYLALKCRNRPHRELMRMWRKVRDMHHATVRRVGVRAVARAKHSAERAARAQVCR